MTYLIYLRKSRADREAEARGEGETLARHEARLTALAAELGLHIGDIYRELVSGETISARPLMQKLLTQVEQGFWEGVLVMEIERLARGNTIDQGLVARAFQYSGTRIITPMKIYDPNNEFDEEYFEFGLFMSRREYKTINRRMQQGRYTSAAEGKFIGNKAPYGYERQKLPDKGYTLIPHQEKAEILRRIFQRFGYQQLSPAAIAQELNELAIPSPSGGIWSAASIRNLLANPVYSGIITSGRRPSIKKLDHGKIILHRPVSHDHACFTGLHQPLIDEKLAAAVSARLGKKDNTPASSRRPLQNPLAGLLFCAVCGKKMIRRPGKGGAPALLLCPTPHCMTVGSYLAPIEEAVLDMINTHWGTLTAASSAPFAQKEKIAFLRREMTKTDKTLQSLKKQAENACDLLEQGIYDADTFCHRQKILEEKIQQQENTKGSLLQKLNSAENENNDTSAYSSIIDIYQHCCDTAQKNKLLKCLFRKIIYERNNGGRWKDTAVKLTFYPLLPPLVSSPAPQDGRIGSFGDHSHFGFQTD